MKKILLIVALVMAPLFVFQALAQDRTVTGVVTSVEDGGTIPGATVMIKGTQLGTVTNFEGVYTLNVPGDATTLIFTYVGMKTQEVAIDGRNSIDMVMETDVLGIDEVIVTAYGTAKKGAFTGSATQINSNKIELRPIANVTQAIEGSGPGIQVTAADGQPGSSQSIRVRGFGSYSGSNSPLYVVDGVPYSGSISAINPTDIESVTVLKDAASTALYGNRAANGVIMITTKQGKIGPGTLSINASYGMVGRSQPEYELIDAFDYYPILWEAERNSNAIPGIDTPADVATASQNASDDIYGILEYNPFDVPNDQIVGTDGKINPNANWLGDYEESADWLDAVTQRGQRQNYDLSYQGGTEKVDYYFSVGYLLEEGFIWQSDLTRFSGRANVNVQATEWLKTGINVSGSNRVSNFAQTGSSNTFVNPIRFTRGIGSIYPVHMLDPVTGLYILDDNGKKQYDIPDHRAGGASSGRHVVAEIDWDSDIEESLTIGARTYAEITFLNDFKFTTNVSLDQRDTFWAFYNNPIIGDGAPGGRAYRSFYRTASVNFNQLLTYVKTFGNHNFDMVLGHESYKLQYNRLRGARTQQVADDNTELINFVTITRSDSYQSDYSSEGYLGRVNYDFMNKYFISASYRRDGSSKFHVDNRWGNFWSVGGAWRIDQEAFFGGFPFIDMMKLRGSYGQVGNDSGIDRYAYQALYSLGRNNQSEAGIIIDKLAANELVWESNNSMDVGLEFGLFNQIFGTVEYYYRNSENLLFAVPLPLSTGVSSRTMNIGSMSNQGLELSLAWDAVRTQEFKWNIGINLSTLKNEFSILPQDEIITGSKKLMVGHSIYDYWLREYYGVDPDDGAVLYYADDTEAGSRIVYKGSDTLTTDHNNARYGYVGTAIPDVYGSISNSISYKGFELNFMFTYQLGGEVLDYNYQGAMSAGTFGTGYSVDILDRWQKPGDKTDVPRMDAGETSRFNATSSRWLTDASYLTLRHATLSYNLPAVVTDKVGISRARVYLAGENLFLINARKGMNVQQNFSGTTSNVYTPSRVITLGLNVKF